MNTVLLIKSNSIKNLAENMNNYVFLNISGRFILF